MSKLNSLKANEKLPRGSYFFIKVGHRFYSGEEAETIEVTVQPRDDAKPHQSYHWWHRQHKRARRDHNKGTQANYLKPYQRPDKITTNQLTGKLMPKLVDDQKQAKQFRKKDSVLNACNRLKSLYSDLDIKVTIEYEEGDTK